jgi:hypothetical protein
MHLLVKNGRPVAQARHTATEAMQDAVEVGGVVPMAQISPYMLKHGYSIIQVPPFNAPPPMAHPMQRSVHGDLVGLLDRGLDGVECGTAKIERTEGGFLVNEVYLRLILEILQKKAA